MKLPCAALPVSQLEVHQKAPLGCSFALFCRAEQPGNTKEDAAVVVRVGEAGVGGAPMATKGTVTSTVVSAETGKLQPGRVVATAAVAMAEMVARVSLEIDHRTLRLTVRSRACWVTLVEGQAPERRQKYRCFS